MEDRVKKYNDICINHEELIDRINNLLNGFEKDDKNFDSLIKYYYSNWNEDYESNLSYSILSEDYIYDVLGKDRELGLRLIEIGLKLMKR